MSYRSIILVILLLCVSLGSHAQSEQQLLPSEKKQQTLITQPITLYKGFLRIGLAGEFINIGSTFNDDGYRGTLKYNVSQNTWFVRPKIEYGITDRLQASLYFPFVRQEGSGSVLEEIPGLGTRVFKRELTQKGMQDIEMEAAYQFMLEADRKPSLAVILNLTVPTGSKNQVNTGDPNKEETPTGQGHFTLASGLNVRKINYPYVYNARVDYKYRFEGTKSFEVNEPEISFRHSGVLEFAGQFGFHVNEWMAVLNDISYLSVVGDFMRDGETFESKENFRLDYSPTLTFQIKQLRINQILNFPIIGRNSTADPRFQIGVEYVF